ncbi:MAG: ABC transporter substrate binding protein [Pseudomonadota bacterium]
MTLKRHLSYDKCTKNIPLIAIANYGPHSSLQETIDGIKSELSKLGYIENKNIRYEISDVNFETSLIIQMLRKLKASNPKLLVAISTPIAQATKNMIKDIPLVYADVTDPFEAGLYNPNESTNITGASDKQDLKLMLKFATELLPDLLLLDEHTSALDPQSREKIMRFTDNFIKQYNITSLMITHNIEDAAKYGNRLIILHHGEVARNIKGLEKNKLTSKDIIHKIGGSL